MRTINKLIFMAIVLLFVVVAPKVNAQNSSTAEFKELYELTVKKFTAEKTDTAKLVMIDIVNSPIKIEYEKKHFCLCADEKCHGPRLTISFNKTNVCIFPNGDMFSSINQFQEGVIVIEVDKAYVEKERREQALSQGAAITILSEFCKQN